MDAVKLSERIERSLRAACKNLGLPEPLFDQSFDWSSQIRLLVDEGLFLGVWVDPQKEKTKILRTFSLDSTEQAKASVAADQTGARLAKKAVQIVEAPEPEWLARGRRRYTAVVDSRLWLNKPYLVEADWISRELIRKYRVEPDSLLMVRRPQSLPSLLTRKLSSGSDKRISILVYASLGSANENILGDIRQKIAATGAVIDKDTFIICLRQNSDNLDAYYRRMATAQPKPGLTLIVLDEPQVFDANRERSADEFRRRLVARLAGKGGLGFDYNRILFAGTSDSVLGLIRDNPETFAGAGAAPVTLALVPSSQRSANIHRQRSTRVYDSNGIEATVDEDALAGAALDTRMDWQAFLTPHLPIPKDSHPAQVTPKADPAAEYQEMLKNFQDFGEKGWRHYKAQLGPAKVTSYIKRVYGVVTRAYRDPQKRRDGFRTMRSALTFPAGKNRWLEHDLFFKKLLAEGYFVASRMPGKKLPLYKLCMEGAF
ncbi:MAG: hypothetical protein WCG06_06585, partial [Candidatus Omnitrophota bacterium]